MIRNPSNEIVLKGEEASSDLSAHEEGLRGLARLLARQAAHELFISISNNQRKAPHGTGNEGMRTTAHTRSNS